MKTILIALLTSLAYSLTMTKPRQRSDVSNHPSKDTSLLKQTIYILLILISFVVIVPAALLRS
jgi:hypothetical protein